MDDTGKIAALFKLIEEHQREAGATLETFKHDLEARERAEPDERLTYRASVLVDAWELFEADFMVLRLEAKEILES